MTVQVFLRNDDVRGALDASLVDLTERLAGNGRPITHAVEPGNVTAEVAEWLCDAQDRYPGCVEIIQHGYRHAIRTKPPARGEFGGGRPRADQRADILDGRRLMDQWFGGRWTRAFSFPYGSYDENTVRALDEAGYSIITTGSAWTLRRRALNALGRAMGARRLGRRMVSYSGKRVPGAAIYEFSVMINNTKKQTGPDSAIQRSAEELMAIWRRIPARIPVRGLLCHHRFNRPEDLDQLVLFIDAISAQGARFVRLQDLYETMAGLRRA